MAMVASMKRMFHRTTNNMMIFKFRPLVLMGSTLCVLLLLSALYDNVFRFKKWRLSDACVHKDKENFKYLINENNICAGNNIKPVTILVGVFSGIFEKPLRDFVRSRWGAVAKENSKLRLVFILGRPEKNKDGMTPIHEESKRNRDIIQADFDDSYRGLLCKSFAFFKWAHKYCTNARYLLKIDSDMQIDLMSLVNIVENGDFNDHFQCGELNNYSNPVRDEYNKWYVPEELHPSKTFPLYCQGAAYVVSRRIAAKIAQLRLPNTTFPIDDVYMTGILREKLKEDIEQRIMFFHHHYNETDIKVTEGSFSKSIMTIRVGEKGVSSL